MNADTCISKSAINLMNEIFINLSPELENDRVSLSLLSHIISHLYLYNTKIINTKPNYYIYIYITMIQYQYTTNTPIIKHFQM